VRQVWGNVDTGGGGDLGNLARIGQQFLKEAPTSGTSERLSIGALLGELGAGAVHPPLLVPLLGGTAASLGAARGIGSALQSNWYRNMLLDAANQAGPSTASPILQDIAIPAAISAQKALTLQALPPPLVINSQ
jgi:hypothetical protein